jgi:hypothetical protein
MDQQSGVFVIKEDGSLVGLREAVLVTLKQSDVRQVAGEDLASVRPYKKRSA